MKFDERFFSLDDTTVKAGATYFRRLETGKTFVTLEIGNEWLKGKSGFFEEKIDSFVIAGTVGFEWQPAVKWAIAPALSLHRYRPCGAALAGVEGRDRGMNLHPH